MRTGHLWAEDNGVCDLLSQKLSVETRKSILTETYGLQMTEQIEGVMESMCNLSVLIAEKGIVEGMAEGEAVKVIEIALNLIAGGILSDEQIAAATGLSVDEIKELHSEKTEIST